MGLSKLWIRFEKESRCARTKCPVRLPAGYLLYRTISHKCWILKNRQQNHGVMTKNITLLFRSTPVGM